MPTFTAANAPQGVMRPVKIYGTGGSGSLPLVLDGVTIDMPVEILTRGNQTTAFSTTNSANTFLRPVLFSTYSAASAAEKGSVIKFCGGLTCNNKYEFFGPGEFQILTNSATLLGGAQIQSGAQLVLGATNIVVTGLKETREGLIVNNGTLEFIRDNCFSDDVQLSFNSGSANVIEFNGTTQTVGTAKLVSSHASARLSSEQPAVLVVNGKIRTGADPNYVYASACGVKVTGWVGFHYAGTNELYDTFTLSGKDFASYGDLEVSEGTLEIAENASWLNGTNFTARGTGTLKFSAANQVNKDFAVLHMEDDGKVEIPENITNFVYLAETNGVLLAAGNYTGDGGPSDATVIPQLTGKGVLSVRCADPVKTTYKVKDDREPQISTVVISNSWVNENVPLGKTINDTPECGNGFKYWKNYVLGMNPKDPNSLPIIKGVQNANPYKLAFTLGNVTYNADSGVLAEYTIKESTAINGTYYEKATNTVGQVVEFDLPAEGNLHYYQGVIRYRDAQ